MGYFELMAIVAIGWIAIEIIKAVKGTSSIDKESLMEEFFGEDGLSDGSGKLKKEIAELKERVATLEAIVTDEKYQLNKEINNL